MVLKRVMPCLLYDGSALIKTVQFKNAQYIGDPINAIKIYNEKEVDELILLDVNASREQRSPSFDQVRSFASECFMPFTYGGGVATIDDFARLYSSGVEKVIVNTLTLTRPDLVREAVDQFGSSSVVGSVDYARSLFKGTFVYNASGHKTRRGLLDHCRYLAEEVGVGELMLYSVERDGTWSGLDLPMIREVAESVPVPIIACGGAGSVDHLRAVFDTTAANAAAIGSMAVYQKKGMGVLINFPHREEIITDEVGYGVDA